MQDGMSELERRMIGGVAVLDRMMILDEVNRYAWAWDSGDIDEYLDRYAEDGVFEHPTSDGTPVYHTGREEIRKVDAYCAVLRHEFHRTYWPHGPSFRIGTWHAAYGRVGGEWRIKHLTVKMWTDTAFNSGTAIQDRGPGMVGTGTPFG